MHERLVAMVMLGIALVLIVFIDIEMSSAYQFPNLLAFAMLLVAILQLIFSGKAKADKQMHKREQVIVWQRLWPVLTLLIICLLTIETIGFYFTLFVLFFSLVIIYSPAPRFVFKSVLPALSITILFLGFLYLIFALVLKVQTPSGFLI